MALDPELDNFKRFDLRVYAANLGYVTDEKRSWRGSTVMRRDSEKIVVKRDTDGHYVYFSVADDLDNGTIIDFVMKRKGLNLGRARRELRPWLSGSARGTVTFPPLPATPKSRQAVERAFHLTSEGAENAYLLNDRALPFQILSSSRFAGRCCTDRRGNAVFPHFDGHALCGFEIKNRNFTSFSPGGEKGLWLSHLSSDDDVFVIAESAIDALSFAALFTNDRARYASTGGAFNNRQAALIAKAMLRLPDGGIVMAAMDNDAGGQQAAAKIETIVRGCGRADLRFRSSSPPGEGSDWNDVLRAQTF